MSLKEELEKFLAQFKKDVPEEVCNIISTESERLAQSGISDQSLKVGDKAPAFSLSNGAGKTVSSNDLLSKGPLVVSFYRGGWWPYCNIELRSLQLTLPEIESLGANLVALSPQLPEKSLSTAEENKVSFEVLSDLGNKVAREFGLVFALPESLQALYKEFGIDIATANGDDSYELPIAATYVIDSDGTIVHVFVDTDYTKRLEPAEAVEVLKKLVAKK